MASDFIHIVCLDAPAPSNYGGAIDMYYKITALAVTGKKIILHYFDYNPQRNVDELKEYCYSIYSYSRKQGIQSLLFLKPYIVASRINQQLIDRLNNDEHPVILEGIHCSGIIPYLKKNRKIFLRVHNNEAAYYLSLAKTEINLFKKTYFLLEHFLLRIYQNRIQKDIIVACLSDTDVEVFAKKYRFRNVHFIPCFIPWQQLLAKPGTGRYCLYHGNMQVSENEAAATWLLHHVFSTIEIPFIIAGSGISKKLKSLASIYPHVTMVDNPTMAEIDSLIEKAQIHLLPSLNNTGVKLKLLHALLAGKFCITNQAGVEGSKIKNGVFIAETKEEYIQLITLWMKQSFTKTDIKEREPVLQQYNNITNAEKLNGLIS
ncbi:MAG: glycosyltransferase [Bacteroidota bacterium]|nr:glycosyltransferase [Bacteroidota bacterium]